ncbi:MAG TPA: hypothetical protein VFS41_11985 [Edaphobacter sp.]|nr:hypothetical protein [Edaphobacter sp.]
MVNANALLAGWSQSCGCYAKEVNSARATHGHTKGGKHSSTFTVWRSMLARCTDSKHASFHNYGGRGIEVCARWAVFESFLEDMGERPKGKTLDRIDNDGNYCKENCRWVSMKENSNNRRNNRLLTLHGKTHTVSEWAALTGLNESTIRVRLFRGATDEEALRP